MNQVDAFAERLRSIVIQRIEADKLPLPSMPDVALRCLELCKSPNVSLGDVGKEVERDPLLAASLLRLANSAASGATVKMTSVQQAVSRIGLQKLKGHLIQIAARQLFQSRDRRIAEQFRLLWEHSVAVAIVSRDTCLVLGGVDADLAYQAGLLHDVGKPILAIMLLEAEKAARATGKQTEWLDAKAWLHIVQDLHRPVGVALAKKWELASEVQDAIETCTDYDPGDRQSVSNVVRFSNALTKQLGVYTGRFEKSEVETQIMVGKSLIGIDDALIDRVSDTLASQIAELVG